MVVFQVVWVVFIKALQLRNKRVFAPGQVDGGIPQRISDHILRCAVLVNDSVNQERDAFDGAI